MCGIAGIASREPLTPAQLEGLARIGEGLIHRGPDGSGRFEAPHVALTMRRLSIIDPSTGWQPLYNEDRSVALIANGEIYNYVELREELTRRGHRFRTGSDCEMIPHLYEDFGDDCVQHLRGMFAFALWDANRRRLVLARDRMGEKPLYLYERDGELIFASELRALLQSGNVPFELNPAAVDLYFHYQYVPEPLTPLRGVRKLPAAHLLAVELDSWSTRETCYWRMEDAPPLDEDPVRRIRAELESISEIVIRSDVPVGIALSGGVDSSAIAVLAARRYPGTMQAFSVGYPGRPHSDERSAAEALANHLGMPFHDVEIGIDEMVEAFPDLVHWRDDPIADMAGYGYYAVARAARERGVPVLLQGQGGDELFWGYPWVVEAARQSERKARRNGTLPSAPEYLRLTFPRLWPRRAPLDWMLSLAGLRPSWDAYRRDRLSPREQLVFYDLTPEFQMATRRMRDLYQPAVARSLDGQRPFDLFTMPRPWPPLEVLFTRLICQTYLLENGITQGDRLSMAASVELRLPLVDHRLIEAVIGLRKTRPDSDLGPKAWFREAIRDLVPQSVLDRPKQGFQPPMRTWNRALFQHHGPLLRDGALVQLGILKPEAAQALARGSVSWGEGVPLSFRALVLEVWSRRLLSIGADRLQPQA